MAITSGVAFEAAQCVCEYERMSVCRHTCSAPDCSSSGTCCSETHARCHSHLHGIDADYDDGVCLMPKVVALPPLDNVHCYVAFSLAKADTTFRHLVLDHAVGQSLSFPLYLPL